MNQRMRYYIYCGVAAIALLFPSGAYAAGWTFTSVKTSFNGLPGAKGNGIDDDKAAIDRAIAAGTTIYFPPGVYLYGGPMTLPANKSYRLYGDGPRVSTIRFSGSGAGISALYMGQKTLNVDGLTLEASSQNCGTAIHAAFSESGGNTKFRTATIHNVQITGYPRFEFPLFDSPNYWTNGIDLSKAQNSVIDKVEISGTHLTQPPWGTLAGIVWKSSSDYATTGLQVSNLQVKYVQTGLQTSGWVEGVYLTGFEIVFGGREGVPMVDLAVNAPGGVQKPTFHLVNGHVQGEGGGVRLTNLTGVKISKVLFLHNTLNAVPGSMVEFNNCTDAVVSQCTFHGRGNGFANENGILLNNADFVRIAENNFTAISPLQGSGIVVQANSEAVRITNNLFGNFIGDDVNRAYDDQAPGTYYRGNNREP